ncbi:MAG: multicopper oxidase [Alphaproteobacteria bacterium]|nr:MAG: multicopper oxidase [Alphaproteobacteria bacterium]
MNMLTTRRAVLRIGAGALAAPFVLRPLPARASGPALPIPALVEPDAAGTVRLRMAGGRHSFVPGQSVPSAGINGAYLGPVVRLKAGGTATLAVENALPWHTTLHWHGLFVGSDLDGGPHNPIAPGQTWTPRVTIDQPPAMTWFHPHLHEDTARQAHLGLAGILIVADGRDRERGLPDSHGVDDLPLILQDRRALEGEAPYAPDALDFIHGFRGTHIAVNGAVRPTAAVPAAIVRLRFLNGANARNFLLRFADRRPLHVIASDGGFLARPAAVDTLVIAPGERFEALVDFSDGRPVELMTLPDDNGRFGSGVVDRLKAAVTEALAGEEPVMTFAPDPALKGGVASLPAGLDEPAGADPATASRRRRFVFDERVEANLKALQEAGVSAEQAGQMVDHSAHGAHAGRPMAAPAPAATAASLGITMAMAGEPFDMGRVDVEAKLGSTEIWELSTQEMAHPFHIHGASLRVISRNGQPPEPHLAGWKDVVLVDGKAEVLVRFDRPAAREKPFMFHCHILEHEDAGMMGQFVTV